MAKIYGKRTINSGENVGSGHPSCADSGGKTGTEKGNTTYTYRLILANFHTYMVTWMSIEYRW